MNNQRDNRHVVPLVLVLTNNFLPSRSVFYVVPIIDECNIRMQIFCVI